MARKIIITDGEDTVTLLSDLEFTIKPEQIGETAVMASGRTVRDAIGIKNTLEIPTGWLSPADLTVLYRMIAKNQILTVTYPDTDGDHTDDFWITPPERKAFSYGADGVSQWYGVTLSCTQYGVTMG